MPVWSAGFHVSHPTDRSGDVSPSAPFHNGSISRNSVPVRPIGLGLRFEFKHRMNIRIDYGFGKGTSGLVVQFAEAF
ncbi:MAG TPA: hypothetical protein IAC05_07265 [Candidatus Coprenecus stercorigallinarum]|nr:hypothetical protein [Candidatus Coprenecus stercorigallinarum]